MLLRKVWTSVVSGGGSSSSSHGGTGTGNGTGDFDRLPDEILGIILRKLGPKEAAKLCVVCKSWRQILISDDGLWIHFFHTIKPNFWDWESIIFSETLLTTTPAFRFPNDQHQLSLVHIYGKRSKVTGALIVDGGSGYCKYGWSKYQRPSGRSATFLEFGNIEIPMYSRLRHFYSTIYSRMHVKSSSHPIVVSIPLCHYDDTESAKALRRQLKGAIYSALFDMNVPAVCAISQNLHD